MHFQFFDDVVGVQFEDNEWISINFVGHQIDQGRQVFAWYRLVWAGA
jgi:hypothetical protein